jgi:predicted O-methyltransferase YrrM
MSLISLYKENGHTTDKWGSGNHPYLTVYDVLFSRLKDKVNNILEIGVYRGDSLNLWAEYFINSKIYGIDPDSWQVNIELHKNVEILTADGYCDETLEKLKQIGKFALIIDDGSHMKEHQKFVMRNYCDLLTDDGILIIEDAVFGVRDSVKYKVSDLLEYFPEELQKYVTFADLRHSGNLNSYLIICNKE